MYIGLDLGTSSLKAILVDEGQTVVAEHAVPLTVQRPHDGWSEQNPASWCDAAVEALRALSTKADLSGVKAIGLAGHMHGATLIGTSSTKQPCGAIELMTNSPPCISITSRQMANPSPSPSSLLLTNA